MFLPLVEMPRLFETRLRRLGLAVLLLGLAVVAGAPRAVAAPPPVDGFADLAEKLMPAVVNISISQTVENKLPQGHPPMNEFFEEFFGQPMPQQQAPGPRKVSSLGSGFVVDAAGIIITNNHVIENADEITVKFSNGEEYGATIIGRDPKTDLAVLQIKAGKKLPFVKFGDNRASRVGDWVIAIGNPFGLGGSLSAGVISAINRDINAGPYDSFIQTDAAINRGNSGGPLFNLDGEVIGVNSAIISPTGGSVGIGFSIPADLAKNVIGQLREYGETRRGWLGVRVQQVTDELAEGLGLARAMGALVAEVTPGGPAEKGGLEPGDVIVTFDSKPVPEMRDLPRLVAETSIKKRVPVTVIRKGKRRKLYIVTGRLEEADLARNDTPAKPQKKAKSGKGLVVEGMTLSTLDDALVKRFNLPEGETGIVITQIAAGSQAAEDNIRVGDIIREVDQRKVRQPADVQRLVKAARRSGKKSLLMLLSTGGTLRFFALGLE